MLCEQLTHPALVYRVHDGPEQADPHCLYIELGQTPRDGCHRRLIQRPGHGPVGVNPFRHLEGETARDKWLRIRRFVIERPQPPSFTVEQHIRMTRGGQECRLAGLAGQHCISSTSSCVDEKIAGTKQLGALHPLRLRRHRQHIQNPLHRISGDTW